MTRKDLQAQLDAVETFMASPAFPLVQFNFEEDVKGHETSITLLRPRTAEDVADLNLLHGKREVAVALLTHFEELRDRLKTELANMEEFGQIVTPTENT